MTCAQCRRLLWPARRGELDSTQRERLAEHLASCEGCSRQASLLKQEDALLERARHTPPHIEDPEALTLRILRAVERDARQRGPTGLLDRIAALVDRPRVRYAVAGFVCTVTCLFLVQQASLFMSVRQLEERIAARDRGRPAPTLAYSVDRAHLEGMDELRSALAGSLPPQGDTLVITLDAVRHYQARLRDFTTPLSGQAAGTRITPEILERALESVVGSLSVSLKLHYSEG